MAIEFRDSEKNTSVQSTMNGKLGKIVIKNGEVIFKTKLNILHLSDTVRDQILSRMKELQGANKQ